VPTTANLHDEIAENGFAIREKILSPSEVTQLLKAIAQIDEPGALQRRNSVYAVRNLLDASLAIRELAAQSITRLRHRTVFSSWPSVVPDFRLIRSKVSNIFDLFLSHLGVRGVFGLP
jgi:hypothetical protein